MKRLQYRPMFVFDELLQYILGAVPMTAPQVHGRGEQQCKTGIERLTTREGVRDCLSCCRHRALWMAAQPQRSREHDQTSHAMIVAAQLQVPLTGARKARIEVASCQRLIA